MEAIDPGVYQAIDDVVDRPARMQDDLIAMLMALFSELAKPRKNETVKLPGTADEALLGAEIIAEEETIDKVACHRKESAVGLTVKLTDLFRDCIDNFRIGMHLDKILFHSEQVGHIMVKAIPESAQTIDIAGIL
jgi:hypothetical protein